MNYNNEINELNNKEFNDIKEQEMLRYNLMKNNKILTK